MRDDDIKHYPVWLREIVFPDNPFANICGRQETLDTERALRSIFENSRVDPAYAIIKYLVIDTIREKHKNREMYKHLSQQIEELSSELDKLKKSGDEE